MTKVLDQESRMAFNIPATWTNRSAVTLITPNFIRVAFGEIAPNETKAFQWNTALMMTADSARGLRNALTEMLQRFDEHTHKD